MTLLSIVLLLLYKLIAAEGAHHSVVSRTVYRMMSSVGVPDHKVKGLFVDLWLYGSIIAE